MIPYGYFVELRNKLKSKRQIVSKEDTYPLGNICQPTENSSDVKNDILGSSWTSKYSRITAEQNFHGWYDFTPALLFLLTNEET